MNFGGCGDQGVWNADAVAAPVLKAVAASKARDRQIDLANVENAGSASIRRCSLSFRTPAYSSAMVMTEIEAGDFSRLSA